MKRYLAAFVVLIVAILLVGYSGRSPFAAQGRIASTAAQRWEYHIGHSFAEAEANALGEQGWELVGIAYASDSHDVLEIYKRPKQ